jgi:hypothetical protein
VSWSIVVKEKPTVGSPIFRVFPSDRIPEAMKEVNVHFFIHIYYTAGIIPANSENFLKLLHIQNDI